MSLPNQTFAGRRVLVIGPGLEGPARQALAGAVIDSGPPGALGEAAVARPGYDLILLDAAAAHAQLLAAMIEPLTTLPSPPAMILAGDNPGAPLVRAILRLSRTDMIEPPYAATEIAAAASRLLAAAQAQPSAPAAPAQSVIPNRCWAVTSAVGGAGATTLAIELAATVSRVSPQRPRVCLIDLNFADGACAPYLGVQANMSVEPGVLAPDRIDASMLDIFAAKPSANLDLLAAPRDALGFEKPSPEAVLKLLDVACQVYPQVVIDMPRHRRPWSLPVLSGCDEIMIVSELTVPALLATRALAEEMESELAQGPKPRIILNRLASRMFGPAPSMSEAEKALGRSADGGLSSDWEAAAASVNLGGSIGEHRPKSRIVRDVEALARQLLGVAAPGRKVA